MSFQAGISSAELAVDLLLCVKNRSLLILLSQKYLLSRCFISLQAGISSAELAVDFLLCVLLNSPVATLHDELNPWATCFDVSEAILL